LGGEWGTTTNLAIVIYTWYVMSLKFALKEVLVVKLTLSVNAKGKLALK